MSKSRRTQKEVPAVRCWLNRRHHRAAKRAVRAGKEPDPRKRLGDMVINARSLRDLRQQQHLHRLHGRGVFLQGGSKISDELHQNGA